MDLIVFDMKIVILCQASCVNIFTISHVYVYSAPFECRVHES